MLAPRGLKRVNERVSKKNPDPCEDAVSSVFDSPLGTHRLDLKFHAPQSLINLYWDPGGPHYEMMLDSVNTIAHVSIWRWRMINQFLSKWLYGVRNEIKLFFKNTLGFCWIPLGDRLYSVISWYFSVIFTALYFKFRPRPALCTTQNIKFKAD